LFVQSLLVPCVFVVFLANLNRRHRFYLLPKEKNFPRRNPLHAEPPLRTSFFPRAAKSSRRTPSQAGLLREKNPRELTPSSRTLAAVGSARQLHLVVSPSCPLASYQKKERKKEGANGLGYLALRKAVKPLPLPPVVVGKSKKGKVIQRKKENSRQSKKRKKEKKGVRRDMRPRSLHQGLLSVSHFFSVLDNAEPLFCFVRFRTRNQQHLIVFSTIIQLRIIV
jgi:hypothetical protein